MCLLLVAAFGSTIKSILIKQPEKKYITQYRQIPDSGIPVVYVADSLEQFNSIQYSPSHVERWLHKNTREVIVWADQ